MAVNVHAPFGVPVNIKFKRDTPILQILTEACSKMKKDFNPDEYDLKYYQKILDVNMTCHYAGIKHNTNLYLVKRNEPRIPTNVRICLQLDNGERKNGEFNPNLSIKQILNELAVNYDVERAVIIFMQREIFSKNFESTTLITLGLGGGSALFRLINRDPERPREQAHVYVPPTPKVSKLEEVESTSSVKPLKNKIFDPISAIKAEQKIMPKQKNETTPEEPKKIESSDFAKVCTDETVKENVKIEPMEVSQLEEENANAIVEKFTEEPQIFYLDDERQALLFNQAGAQNVSQEEIPDDFFNVTINDVKFLYTERKKLNESQYDCPFMTEKLRNLEKEKTLLGVIHKYTKAVIRIYFPNQLVLQGIFRPLETVQQIKDFVNCYLEQPDAEFSLYKTPPRYDLNAEKNLVDEGLVPSAKLYYAGSSDLKPEVKSKLTDPSAATYAAEKTRIKTMRNDDALLDDSKSQQQNNLQTSSNKVPKWFKSLNK